MIRWETIVNFSPRKQGFDILLKWVLNWHENEGKLDPNNLRWIKNFATILQWETTFANFPP